MSKRVTMCSKLFLVVGLLLVTGLLSPLVMPTVPAFGIKLIPPPPSPDKPDKPLDDCTLVITALSPESASVALGGMVEFSLKITASAGDWDKLSATATVQPDQEGIHTSISGLPSKLDEGDKATVTVKIAVDSDVIGQTYTVKLRIKARCGEESGNASRSTELIVGRSGLVESPSSEEPLTLAVTTCEGDPYSSEGETCKTDYDDNGSVDWWQKETCTGDPSSYNYSCTREHDDDGDGIVDWVSKQTCAGTESTRSCTFEYDTDGNGKIDQSVSETCIGVPHSSNYSCTTELDIDGDGKADYSNKNTCTGNESKWSCTIEVDDDGDGIIDRTEKRTCTGDPAGIYSCTTESDYDHDDNPDHESTESGTSGLPLPDFNQRNSTPPLSVVVNEVAWMGTLPNDSSSREWIELYNPTNRSISLNGWRLVSSKPDASIEVTLKGTIPAGGYFLLEQGDDSAVSDITADFFYNGELLDEGMTLLLLDPSGNRVDSVNLNGGSWPAGARIGALALSMERIDPRRKDTDNNWGTNNTVTRNGRDALGKPLNGTPKARNSVTP